MGWFPKRKKRRKSAPGRKYPERKLAEIEEIIEQGMLVADVAVRMTVKNAIIMNALAKRVDYDESQIVEMVRDGVTEVADERKADAEHIRAIRAEVKQRGYSSWMDADYGSGDSRTLRHREEVYDGVAERLYARAEDDDYLARTAERARKAAWREIGDSLKNRVSEPYYEGGHTEEYAQEREARIADLINGELAELMSSRAAPDASRDSRR